MKIAIVTPQAVPLALGGAENLWWGLQDHIDRHTPHSCDIVALPSPEGTFWDLVSSYETFSKLDLSGYDCVISGKYPAWMVDHPYHICYMLHRLRGLYDTYAPGVSDDAVLDTPKLRGLIEWMTEGGDPDPEQIPDLFARLNGLRDCGLPDSAFAFPGPLSRAVVHFLDNAALSPKRISRYAAIAETVRRRRCYFPPEAEVDVLHPPPHRADYRNGQSRYLFTSSRLDAPKRIAFLIEAMGHVREDIPLLIAGTGPEDARLKALAKNDPRIRFLGFVADDDMPGLYADALAVPFVPRDEDYGLVTIEAMKSGKPVLTVTDAGGPCEFVRDGETGFVTAPDAKAFAARLAELVRDPVLAGKMGEKARASVEAVDWRTVADGLLSSPSKVTGKRVIRPKLTVATTFRVFPPMNGGQARVFHLYGNMARRFDIDIVTLVGPHEARSEKEIAPGVLEICIPQTAAHAEAEHAIARQLDRIPVSDIAAYGLIGLTPDYLEAIGLSALTSRAVVASHPYLVSALTAAAPDKPLWYEAQDVEITLKQSLLGATPASVALLDEVRTAERHCWTFAERVFACARRDLDALQGIYGPTRARLHEVPNGVALDETPYTPLVQRRRLQRAAGLAGNRTVLFMGSWHGPNLEAVEDILVMARRSAKTRFLIAGSAGVAFRDRTVPANVELLGTVDHETRNNVLALADAALNPMRSGTGTNLKMLDYFAAGIPVVSTPFGARGLDVVPGRHFIAAETDEFGKALDDLAQLNEDALEAMIAAARKVAEERYSWRGIAEAFLTDLSESGFDLPQDAPA